MTLDQYSCKCYRVLRKKKIAGQHNNVIAAIEILCLRFCLKISKCETREPKSFDFFTGRSRVSSSTLRTLYFVFKDEFLF